MKSSLLVIAMLMFTAAFSQATAQNCLEYGPTVSLNGRLHSRIFPGPPNYESIRKGDRKEMAWLLTLCQDICTAGNDSQGFDVPETRVREVQLVITNDAHWKTARQLIGKHAIVAGALFHAFTGHHRTKVLMDVSNIRAAVMLSQRKVH